VVHSIIDVVAQLAILGAFSDNSGGEMASFLTEMSAGLGDDFVALVLGEGKHFHLGLAEVGGGVASAQVQYVHVVALLFPDFHALISDLDGLFETLAAVLTRPTVEVQTFKIDSHFFYLLESLLGLLSVIKIVSKLIGEDSGQLM